MPLAITPSIDVQGIVRWTPRAALPHTFTAARCVVFAVNPLPP